MTAWMYCVLPGCCVFCQSMTDLQRDLCEACAPQLPLNHSHCRQCGLPTQSPIDQCGECISSPPAFSKVYSPLVYEDTAVDLIHRFKYLQQHSCGRVLIDLLAEVLVDKPRPELLLPVPSHWRKQWLRGFNPPNVIAEQLSESFDIPLNKRVLQKCYSSKPQAHLGRKERIVNLKKLYVVRDQAAVEGKHIALVDDVMTTGATVRLLSSMLIQAGAKKVDVWVLARTPKKD